MFERIKNVVDRCITQYDLRSREPSRGEAEREKFKEYADDFRILKKEIAQLEPKPIIFDGAFKCPSCLGSLDKICEAAEDTGEHLNFCSWCGQAIDAYIEME